MEKINKPQVAIVDYEMGNLFSVMRACQHVGLKPVITDDSLVIMNSDAVILPGVGAFGNAMDNLKKRELITPLYKFIETGKPFMGICLGMQLLFSESEEFGSHKGLDIIRGAVIKFPTVNCNGEKLKVPHIGWNKIYRPPFLKEDCWDQSLLKGINNGEFMYFVHSFLVVPADAETVLSFTNYENIEYCSGILWRNVCAFQFHPERSGKNGLSIYNNLKAMIYGGTA